MMRETCSVSHAEDHPSSRRDFLYYATGGMGAVTVGAAVWPLINQMNPSADVQAASTLRVDVGDLPVGSQLTVLFLGKPIFVRHRSQEEIDEARAVEISDLMDPIARNANSAEELDAADENRALAPFGDGENTGEWLVMWGVCTHLGCVPLGDGAGDWRVSALAATGFSGDAVGGNLSARGARGSAYAETSTHAGGDAAAGGTDGDQDTHG